MSLVSTVSAFRKLRDEAKRTPTRACSVSVVTALPSQGSALIRGTAVPFFTSGAFILWIASTILRLEARLCLHTTSLQPSQLSLVA
jgi:hypothetical protein